MRKEKEGSWDTLTALLRPNTPTARCPLLAPLTYISHHLSLPPIPSNLLPSTPLYHKETTHLPRPSPLPFTYPSPFLSSQILLLAHINNPFYTSSDRALSPPSTPLTPTIAPSFRTPRTLFLPQHKALVHSNNQYKRKVFALVHSLLSLFASTCISDSRSCRLTDSIPSCCRLVLLKGLTAVYSPPPF
jgi:hypothetical protein